jgi:hypothetical protein
MTHLEFVVSHFLGFPRKEKEVEGRLEKERQGQKEILRTRLSKA